MRTIKRQFKYWEWVDHCENTPRIDDRYNSSDKEGVGFTGTNSLAEAIKLAREGWDAGINQLEADIGFDIEIDTIVTKSIVGSSVNVGAFLQNQPECMWKYEDITNYNRKKITLYVPTDYNGGVGLRRAMKYCKSIIKITNLLHKDYDLRVVGFFCTRIGNKMLYDEVIIKDFDQNFVLNNIAFAFHPSFLRRLWFKHYETILTGGGYGSAQSTYVMKRTVVDNFEEDGDVYMVPSIEDGQDITFKDCLKINEG